MTTELNTEESLAPQKDKSNKSFQVNVTYYKNCTLLENLIHINPNKHILLEMNLKTKESLTMTSATTITMKHNS